jgi:hypothetical protein
MKQTNSTFIPAPLSGRSIVNSVTEDEDELGYSYNHHNVWKELTCPKEDFVFPTFPPAHFSSFSSMGGNPQPIHQDSILPPFRSSTTQTAMMQLSREPALMDTQAYLTRYERMINEQETELSSTLSHMQPLFELLDYLATPTDLNARPLGSVKVKRMNLSKSFATRDLHRALRVLEEHDGYETVKTDKQFMMALRVLCEHETNTIEFTDESTSLGEILQCYRMCIIGMQTLELLPSGIVRDRAKDRTLRMLSMFRPSSLPLCIPSPSTTEFSTLHDFEKDTKPPRHRTPASKLFLSFIAGALAVLGFCMFAYPSGFQRIKIDHLTSTLVHEIDTKALMEMKQKMIQGKDLAHPLRSSRYSNCITLERSLSMPVLTRIENLRSNQTFFHSRRPLSSARDLSKEKLRETIVDERTTAPWKKGSLFNPEAVMKTLGSSTAGLYLLVPIVTATPSWLAMAGTFLVACIGGQAVREWVDNVKRKYVRP